MHRHLVARVWDAVSRHPALVIFALALALRLAWVLSLSNGLTWIDEQEFAEIGRHLARGDGYVSTSYRANPVVPFYLALVFRLCGENLLVARIGQSVIGALTCVLIFRIGSLLVNQVTGILSGLLLVAYLPHVYLAGVFYVDCWLTFLCTLAMYCAVRAMREVRVELAILSGVTLGLTVLTRPIFLLAVPSVAFGWAVSRVFPPRRRAVMAASMAVACAVTIAPWTARNYAVFGRFILVSSGFYTMLWRGNNELATGGPEDRIFTWSTPEWYERVQRVSADRQRALMDQSRAIDQALQERERLGSDRDLAVDDILKPLAIESVVAHPGRTAVLVGKKMRTLFSAFSDTATQRTFASPRNHWLAAVAFYPMLTFALIGAILALPRWHDLTMIYLLVASISCGYAMLTACTRFRLPLDPYLIVFASLAVNQIGSWAIGRRAIEPSDHLLVADRQAIRSAANRDGDAAVA